MDTVFKRRIDSHNGFQYINDVPSVVHSYHYITRLTSFAFEMEKIDGPLLLQKAMEETFFLVLKKYFVRHDITTPEEKTRTAQDYFGFSGLGLLNISAGIENGSAEMPRSHIDEGWIETWGRSQMPVNHAGCGYIAAAFALIHDFPMYSYHVREVQSIVTGASVSRFEVVLKKEQE